jgi:C4-dicarboxylate-specific signal transduction histidine kinase
MASDGDEILPSDGADPSANDLIRRLAGRYLLVLAAIAALVVVDQLIIQPLLMRLSWYAPAINVAGRQRMLSQKLTKAALALQAADDDQHRHVRRGELGETLKQWSLAYSALREGNHELGIPRIESPAIEHEWGLLAPHYNAMCNATERIIRTPQISNHDVLTTDTAVIVDHEESFLVSMDRIVKLMENEAAAAIFRLRVGAAAIAASVIALLLALGWFVIRPATHTIRRQVDELELQVAERTRELSAALNALRHEVEEREQAEFKTQRLAVQLAHAARVSTMGHLTTGLAHELNQPLATIANYMEAGGVELAGSPTSAQTERLRKYLDLAKHAALRAGQIVRRMRSFVRPHSAAASRVDVDSLICEVIELCKTEIEHAAAEVSLEFADEPVTVCVDPVQIQQVLVNLVQNALQAMIECSAHQRRIEVRTTVADDVVQVDVTDCGHGFVTTDSETVFAPFYTTKRDGLGIGLSICRTIVEEHGGTIWAESEPGRGAKVTFTLPLAENHVGSRQAQSECVCR